MCVSIPTAQKDHFIHLKCLSFVPLTGRILHMFIESGFKAHFWQIAHFYFAAHQTLCITGFYFDRQSIIVSLLNSLLREHHNAYLPQEPWTAFATKNNKICLLFQGYVELLIHPLKPDLKKIKVNSKQCHILFLNSVKCKTVCWTFCFRTITDCTPRGGWKEGEFGCFTYKRSCWFWKYHSSKHMIELRMNRELNLSFFLTSLHEFIA